MEVLWDHVWVAVHCPACAVIVVVDDKVAIDFKAVPLGGSDEVLELFRATKSRFDSPAQKTIAEVEAVDWVVASTEPSAT